MSMSMATPRTGFKFMLTVRDGPDTGATFQLLPPRATIGRGADCHVVLNDPRVSRTAAVIEFSMERVFIQELSQRQALLVNGEFTTEHDLKDGDLIRVGETELVFFVEAIALGQQGRPFTVAPQLGAAPGFPPGFQTPPAGGSFRGTGGLSGKQKFYIGLAIFGGLFGLLMMSETKKPKQDAGPRTIEEIEKEIKVSGEHSDEIIKKREFKNDEEKTRFYEAQKHFSEGFRDYQKNQFARAMRSFETCRTIDPQHQLCMRYYKLSEKSRDAMIAELILEGRRYREKGMWARCSAQFDKVLDMIQNKDEVKYKAADQMRKECDLMLDGRFRQ